MESFFLPNGQQVEDMKNALTNRNFRIGEKLSLTVDPESSSIALTVDVTTPYIYVSCGADTHASFDVLLQHWQTKEGKRTTGVETIVRALGVKYDTSQWISAKGETVTIRIKNNDAVARTFDVHVFGVR